MRVLFLVVTMTALAAFNALVLPLALERTILAHPRTPTSLLGQCSAALTVESPFSSRLQRSGVGYLGWRLTGEKPSSSAAARLAAFADAFKETSAPTIAAFEAQGCAALDLQDRCCCSPLPGLAGLNVQGSAGGSMLASHTVTVSAHRGGCEPTVNRQACSLNPDRGSRVVAHEQDCASLCRETAFPSTNIGGLHQLPALDAPHC